jgi:hypothetical protein
MFLSSYVSAPFDVFGSGGFAPAASVFPLHFAGTDVAPSTAATVALAGGIGHCSIASWGVAA